MMDKSAFNVKLDDLCSYSMTDKSEIQSERTRFPFCALLQMMDILSDKAIGTSNWEQRFLPKMGLYLTDFDRFAHYLDHVSLTEIQSAADIKAKQQVEKAKDQEFAPTDDTSFDIMREINSYQEVSFKTAPKSVILSKFLETGNYKPEDLGEMPTISVEDLGKKSIEQDDSLNTETMALIYEKQGHFDRAISIYEKLVSRNPEKSSTFAIRISELKMKLENSKK